MKKLFLICVLLTFSFSVNAGNPEKNNSFSQFDKKESTQKSAKENKFKCDGRTHCSQMTSCEEATFFLNNCPNTKMDGNNDGIPCEKQFCKQNR